MKSEELKNFIEETIFSEVKNTILNENKEEKNKEVYHIMCDNKPLASFKSKKEAEIALPKFKENHKGKKLIIEKAKYDSYADMIEAFDKMSEELENETMEKQNMNESLSPEGMMKLKNACDKMGCRKVAMKLVDKFLNNMVGLESADLGDTAIFANGLDEIEMLLEDEDWDTALNVAKETAESMLDDEGFSMEMDETTHVGEEEGDVKESRKNRDSFDNIPHDKITYDDNGNNIKTERHYFDDIVKIKGKNFDMDVPELNLSSRQEIRPFNPKKFSDDSMEMDETTHVGEEEGDIEESVKGMCSECGKMLTEEGTMCSECSSLKENKISKKRITDLIAEAMKGNPGTPGVVGKTTAIKAAKESGKEAQKYYNDVRKKIENALNFDGNTNPKFPHQNGGDKMAINPTKEQADEIAKNKAGLQNLDYDIEPSENFKKRLEAALKGDSTMGNSSVTGKNSIKTSNGAKAVDAKEESGNTIPTETDKFIDKQKKDRQKDKDERALYNRAAVPTKAKSKIVNEEILKMKHLLTYNKKTQ